MPAGPSRPVRCRQVWPPGCRRRCGSPPESNLPVAACHPMLMTATAHAECGTHPLSHHNRSRARDGFDRPGLSTSATPCGESEAGKEHNAGLLTVAAPCVTVLVISSCPTRAAPLDLNARRPPVCRDQFLLWPKGASSTRVGAGTRLLRTQPALLPAPAGNPPTGAVLMSRRGSRVRVPGSPIRSCPFGRLWAGQQPAVSACGSPASWRRAPGRRTASRYRRSARSCRCRPGRPRPRSG